MARVSAAERHLPLKAAAFHILLALADGDGYGYQVMRQVREQSEGRVRIGPGAFYRHLERLLGRGLVVEAPRPADDDPRRGAWYRLSGLGREVLALEGRRLGQLSAAVRRLAPQAERGAT